MLGFFISADLSSEDAYLDAMNDMLDPLLPTRGHALFQLSKLLQKRNKWAIKDCDRLLGINFMSH